MFQNRDRKNYDPVAYGKQLIKGDVPFTPKRAAKSLQQVGPPTETSANLLLSLPQFIFADIIDQVIGDCLLAHAIETPFFSLVTLTNLILDCRDIWTVSWNWRVKVLDVVLGTLSARRGMFVLVPVQGLNRIQKAFPMLNHCVLNLGNMNDVQAAERALTQLTEQSARLSIVRAVMWDESSFHPTIASEHPSHMPKVESLMRHYWDYLLNAEGAGNMQEMRNQEQLIVDAKTLHLYHVHLIRNILSHIGPAAHIMIPSFIMPVLLGDWPIPSKISSGLQNKIDSIIETGKPIGQILQQADHIQFAGFSNLFLLTGTENRAIMRQLNETNEGALYEIVRLALSDAHHNTVSTSPTPGDILGREVKSIAFHNSIELLNPHHLGKWWFEFLNSSLAARSVRRVNITTLSSQDGYIPLGSARSFSLHPASSGRILKDTVLHFCTEFIQIERIHYLNLHLRTLCPAFFTNAADRLRVTGGRWNITSAPELCAHWLVSHPQPAQPSLDEDIEVVEILMKSGKKLAEKLELKVSFMYQDKKSQPMCAPEVHSLDLYPGLDRIAYTRNIFSNGGRHPSCGVSFSRHGFGLAIRVILRDTTSGLFHSLSQWVFREQVRLELEEGERRVREQLERKKVGEEQRQQARREGADAAHYRKPDREADEDCT
ncbi:hypothetical protein BJY04DRAFT_221320 [Aspergillus karnatakaensis]|uniref:uncharacterized protein n=1 Tax=Aspergillus karnatakaensis TaxID=1810916 RepID=UPI003CCE51CE